MSYLVEISEATPTITSYESYMNIITEKYKLREILKVSYFIQQNIENNLSPEDVIKLLESSIKKIYVKDKNADTEVL